MHGHGSPPVDIVVWETQEAKTANRTAGLGGRVQGRERGFSICRLIPHRTCLPTRP